MNYHDRLCRGLAAMGYRPAESRSKYTTFRSPKTGNLVFVGPNGALRVGRCATKSSSVGDPANQTHAYLHVLSVAESVRALSAV